jgi:diaminopimelate epimerase
MKIPFDKMEGAGNDFIMIDNRSAEIPNTIKEVMVKDYCRRGMGIGADGMIFLQPDKEYDFSWDFFNSDGSKAEMCGNGARCAARFAHKVGAAGREMTFRTLAGPIQASLTERGAKVRLTSTILPKEPAILNIAGQDLKIWSLNTGVPHAVIEVADLENCEVKKLGRQIRFHKHFAPAGTNVNFFKLLDDGFLAIRTYERGVEDETLACGTGTVATCIVAGMFYGKGSPITALTRSGEELVVYFTFADGKADPIFLEGGARTVFTGSFEMPTL